MDGVTLWQIGAAGEAAPIPLGQGRQHLPQIDGPGYIWIRVDCARTGAREWLEGSGLEPLVLRALLAPETRPRCAVHGEGILMNLRGVNLNPGDEVEDMVSLRMWITARLVVTVQLRRLMAVGDVMAEVERGLAPEHPPELVTRLALCLADRAEPVVTGLNEQVDDLEDQVIDGLSAAARFELGTIRRVAIMLRRHMAPQRDALSTFEIEELPWVRAAERSRLREATERMTRLAEELDAIRDRAQVVQDQIMDSRAEVMNRQMLVLSVVAAIFLPLGLITGLLGINVGGVPGAESPAAFWIVSGALLAIGAVLAWLFYRIGMLGK